MNLLELVAVKARFIILGLAIASVVQAPLLYMAGVSKGALVHSVLLLVFGPMAATAFWLRRRG